MEKKQLISVVKPLIAAALLFGSSGGVAWGQIYKNQRNPERAQLRAYGDLNGGLKDLISGAATNGNLGSCSTTYYNYKIQGSFTVDNNFGAHEEGTITPAGGDAFNTNSGKWNSSSYTYNPFNTGNGIITVGNAINHIGHHVINVSSSGFSRHENASGATTTVNSSQSASYNDTGNGCNDTKYWNIKTQFDDYGTHVTTYGGKRILYSGGSYTACDCREASDISVAAPITPKGSGWLSNTVQSYTTETEIKVNGASKTESVPWRLETFNFMPNNWYYYETTLNSGTCTLSSPDVYYPGYAYNGSCGWSQTTLTKNDNQTVTHKYVTSATLSKPGGQLDSRIVLMAGSHVWLSGHSNTSIGGNNSGKTAYLDLPSGYYTLMNDAAVTLAAITASNIAPLGTNSVFGVNTTLDKGIQTNPSGGTILIGAISRTNSGSQSKIHIQAASGNVGESLGFATSGKEVYTGTCIPATGTANLGNYQSDKNGSISEEITVDNSLNLPPTLGTGALQIFNTKNNLVMDKAYTPTMGTGHMLIMAYSTLKRTKALTVTGSSSGNTNLVGGDVVLTADETYNGTNTGSYRVIAYGNGIQVPASFGAFSFNWGNCSGAYSWCSSPEQNRF